MYILTKAQANQCRGVHKNGTALAPRLMRDGKFAMPEAVASDPVYGNIKNFVLALPKVPDGSISNGVMDPGTGSITGGDWEIDPAKVDPCTYNSTWQEGVTVVVP